MNTNFKTALFGGFDREDVVSYIQQTSRENQQRVSALEEENHGLQERNRAMEAELNTLRRAVLERPAGREVVLTGRDPAPWMREAADYSTEMRCHRHPYARGVLAREGVEF